MGDGHGRAYPDRRWGEPPTSWWRRATQRVRSLLGPTVPQPRDRLPELPVALQRSELAGEYRSAETSGDHRRAGAVTVAAMERAMAVEEWWPADVWAHRALWHFERGALGLQAVRQARRIGDLRWAAGDPASARRYYAEAIDEARDIGAEHEQGLAALGLGRAMQDLGAVSEARRLAGAAVTLLERCGAPRGELDAARGLLGTEVAVGERQGEGS